LRQRSERRSHIFSAEKIDESGSWNFLYGDIKNIPDRKCTHGSL